MKKWQSIILDHHNAEILNDKQVHISNVAVIPETGEYFDNIITQENNRYIIEEYKHGTKELTNVEYETESILNYLGY